jgi:hypothetical protein
MLLLLLLLLPLKQHLQPLRNRASVRHHVDMRITWQRMLLLLLLLLTLNFSNNLQK